MACSNVPVWEKPHTKSNWSILLFKQTYLQFFLNIKSDLFTYLYLSASAASKSSNFSNNAGERQDTQHINKNKSATSFKNPKHY